MFKSQPTSWDLLVPCVRYAINTSQHDVMKTSPYELLHFRPATTFLDISIPGLDRDFFTRQLALIKRVRAEASRRIQLAQDQRTSSQPDVAGFQKDDLVLVHKNVSTAGMNKKFQIHQFGPYVVIKRITPATYEVQKVGVPERTEVVNLRNMKRYHDRQSAVPVRRPDKTTDADDISDDEAPDLIYVAPYVTAPREAPSHIRGSEHPHRQLQTKVKAATQSTGRHGGERVDFQKRRHSASEMTPKRHADDPQTHHRLGDSLDEPLRSPFHPKTPPSRRANRARSWREITEKGWSPRTASFQQ